MTASYSGLKSESALCVTSSSCSDEESFENNNNNNCALSADCSSKKSLLIKQPKQAPCDSALASPDLPRCQRCDRPIGERYFLRVGDALFHCRCLSCWACGDCLETAGRCYSKDGRLYCWEDYCRLFSQPQSCPRCHRLLHPSDLVMRAGSRRFHAACFTCGGCRRPFAPGDTFGMDAGGEVYCRLHLRNSDLGADGGKSAKKSTPTARPKGRPKKPHLCTAAAAADTAGVFKLTPLSTVAPAPTALTTVTAASHLLEHLVEASSSDAPAAAAGVSHDGDKEKLSDRLAPVADSADEPSHIAELTVSPSELDTQPQSQRHQRAANLHHQRQQQQRQKRVRTSFKHHQLRTMKAYFLVNHNPDSKDLKQLAQKTCLSKRVLQVWFQNARAKHRRSLLKQPHLLVDGQPDEEQLQLLQQYQLEEYPASDLSSNAALPPTEADKSEDRSDKGQSVQGFISLHNVNCSA